MKPENDLDSLAIRHGADKFAAHRYTPVYHRYFQDRRRDPITLLEIGIGGYDNPSDPGGASLRMWQDYFRKATIFGLDYYPKPGIEGGRITVFQGDQSDPRTIARIVDAAPGNRFDIIIDDGSHRNEHVITTFMMMFRFVAEGGWYVVEDIQTSYWPSYGGSSEDLGAQTSSMSFFKRLADGLNWREMHRPGYSPTYCDLNVVSVHFYHNMVFIEKGSNLEQSNYVVNNRLPDAL